MTDWRDELRGFLDHGREDGGKETDTEMERFMAEVAAPAFEELRNEMSRYGREVTIRNSGSSASLAVYLGGDEELTYRIQGRMFPNGMLPYVEVRYRERKGLKLVRAESMIRSGPADYALMDITSEEIIRDFLGHYTRRVDRD